MVCQDSRAHLSVHVYLHGVITILKVVNLGLALKNNLNNALFACRKNISKLRINPSLLVILGNKGLRKLNDRSATEDIDIALIVDSIDILRMIDARNVIGSINRNYSVGTHSSDELAGSEDDSTLTVSANNINKLNHLLRIEGRSGVLVSCGTTSSIYSCAQCILNVNIDRISNSLSHDIHNLSHNLGTIKHSFIVDCASATDSVSINSKGVRIKTESLVNTRSRGTSKELLRTIAAKASLKGSLFIVTDNLNLSKDADSIDNFLRNNLIDCFNHYRIYIITVLHKAINIARKSFKLIAKGVIYILNRIISRRSTASGMES